MVDEDPGDELRLEPAVPSGLRRRGALWGALAAIAVLGGALAFTARDDDGEGGPPSLPVALGGLGLAADAAMSSELSRLAWVTYVAGDDLPALGGEGTAYRVAGSVDAVQVAAVGAALGVEGEPQRAGDGLWRLQTDDATLEVSEGFGSGWRYTPTMAAGGGTSGSAGRASAGCEAGPLVDCASVEPDAGMPTTTVVEGGDVECRVDIAEDGTTTEECTADPQSAADLPSDDEARSIALDLLAATGMDVDDIEVQVDGPYDAWYVTVEPRLNGVLAAGWTSSVAVGAEGRIASASGYLGKLEALGDYPLLDTRAAIDRFNEQIGGWFAYAPNAGVAFGSSGTAEASEPLAACAGDPRTTTTIECNDTAICVAEPGGSTICDRDLAAPPGEPICEVLSTPADGAVARPTCGAPEECIDTLAAGGSVDKCAPVPAPEPVEVVLTTVEPVLVALPATDGSTDTYLVPGYRFTGDNGAVDVPAIADASLVPTSSTETTVSEGPQTTQTCTLPDGEVVDPCVKAPPPTSEPVVLTEGEQPEIGVPYYVDVGVMTGHCDWISVEVADRWWWSDLTNEELAHWSTPTEGGTFTLIDEDRAEFVGDTARTKVAELVQFDDGTRPPLCG